MRTDDLLEYLEERMVGLTVDRDTRAYIIGVFREMNDSPDKNMSDESVVLAYANAVQTGAFQCFQRVADWALWSGVFVPESLTSQDVITELGMKSYDACNRLMMGSWPCFNELTLRLPDIIVEVRNSVFSK